MTGQSLMEAKRDGRARVGAYKPVTTGVLLVGLGLDVASLRWSMEEIGAVVFTPLGETILSLWFLAAFFLGVLAFRHVNLPNVPSRVFQAVIVFYMLALAAMHASTTCCSIISTGTSERSVGRSTPMWPVLCCWP
jgi:hypothetical protein